MKNRTAARTALAATLASAISALAACGGAQDDAAQQNTAAEADDTVALHEYTVRAIVLTKPSPDNPLAEFTARHEAIPEFRGKGDQMGMDVMDMGFPLAEGLSLDHVESGDKVTIRFTVDYDTQKQEPIGYRAVEITPLPDDTELDFTPLPRDDA